MANILIIDDDPEIRQILTTYLNDIDHMPMVVDTLSDGIDAVESVDFALVFLDVNLPDGCGLDALSAIRSAPCEPEVIIITGEGNASGARIAFDCGAWDYILKPFSRHEIKLQVQRSLEFRASKKALAAASENILDRSGIIGSSPQLMQRLGQVAQCAKSDANVLITGQTGTGKELFARTIHTNSRQQSDRFTVVDCAALPEQLVESVLFGHVKGAFTGADAHQEGLVKKADGGTLFLDEIGELPLATQTKFLRVLQERRFKPVGGTRDVVSHFRLISATNRDLDKRVAENRFRSDLLFRLRTIHIHLPPLKECAEDIKDLTLHYIYSLCRHHGFENKGFVPEFLDVLESYHWPGNTRELIAGIEKAILADPRSPVLYPNYLPNRIRLNYLQSSMDKKQPPPRDAGVPLSAAGPGPMDLLLADPIKPFKEVKDRVLDEIGRLYLRKLMQAAKGEFDKAADLSGLSKSHIYSLLKKYNIPRR